MRGIGLRISDSCKIREESQRLNLIKNKRKLYYLKQRIVKVIEIISFYDKIRDYIN